jgi:hypothetical protein
MRILPANCHCTILGGSASSRTMAIVFGLSGARSMEKRERGRPNAVGRDGAA